MLPLPLLRQHSGRHTPAARWHLGRIALGGPGGLLLLLLLLVLAEPFEVIVEVLRRVLPLVEQRLVVVHVNELQLIEEEILAISISVENLNEHLHLVVVLVADLIERENVVRHVGEVLRHLIQKHNLAGQGAVYDAEVNRLVRELLRIFDLKVLRGRIFQQRLDSLVLEGERPLLTAAAAGS